MAKTRAQRKAERRRRQQQAERQRQRGDLDAPERTGGRSDDARARDSATRETGGGATRDAQDRAQHDTQVPRSGEEAEVEAVIETGARTEDYGERTVERGEEATDRSGSPVPGVVPEVVRPEPPAPEPLAPEAPAPSRADVGRPDDGATAEAPPARETREQRRARKRREKEERRKARARELQREQAAKAEKRRRPVTGFLASCWAELKRVQWPDRDTLVQASAVTLIFVALMAAYLGALDGVFNWLIKQII